MKNMDTSIQDGFGHEDLNKTGLSLREMQSMLMDLAMEVPRECTAMLEHLLQTETVPVGALQEAAPNQRPKRAAEDSVRFSIRLDTDDLETEARKLSKKKIAQQDRQLDLFAAPEVSYDACLPTKAELKLETEAPTVVRTHQQRMELYAKFLNNLKAYHSHPTPQIKAELDIIVSQIDPTTLWKFFTSQSPKLMEKFNNYINPQHMAEQSTMDVEVRKMNAVDKNRKNDGRYCLFLTRGGESLMVHFSRKNGFILYLIYLMDRKQKGDKVDTLKISEFAELFDKLYEMVYGIRGGTAFSDMMKNYNAQGEARQKSLYTVLQSIRNDVGSTCARLNEPAEPFLLRDTMAHLAVLPKHISLPAEMMLLM